MRASRYSRKRSNFDVTRRGLRSSGASPWSSRRTVFRSRPVTRAISLMLFPLTQASWMSMNSPRPTISRDLLLQRELLQQEPRTPGLGWGISDRRYLGSFTPALTLPKPGHPSRAPDHLFEFKSRCRRPPRWRFWPWRSQGDHRMSRVHSGRAVIPLHSRSDQGISGVAKY